MPRTRSLLLEPPSSGKRSKGPPSASQTTPLAFVSVFAVLCVLPFALLPAFVSVSHAESGLPRSDRPTDARVYFITPEDGQSPSSPVIVRFGLGGMGVAPAGIEKSGTGHHHLVIDAELPPSDLPVPMSEHYRHFGKGQTEVTLELAPGQHTLQLLLADHLHIPHDPPVVSERISITVKE